MTIFQLECFCALAESLNFTQTANAMFITQPALSRAISSLEQELQMTLLQRTTHNVRLTSAGKTFARECEILLRGFRLGTTRARSAQSGKIGSIRVGFPRDIFETFVVDFLNMFRQKHPDIALELVPHSLTGLRNALVEKSVDVIITGGLPPADTTKKLLLACRQECVVLPLDHPLADRESIHMEELRDEKFVVMSRSISFSGYESIIQKALEAGFEAQIVAQVEFVPTLMTMVACGTGISILHRDMIASASDRIAFVPLENIPTFKRWLMWDESNENPCLAPLITLAEEWEKSVSDSEQ